MEENKNNKQVDKKSFAYTMGQAIAGMTAACIVMLMLAVTVKIIIWMF